MIFLNLSSPFSWSFILWHPPWSESLGFTNYPLETPQWVSRGEVMTFPPQRRNPLDWPLCLFVSIIGPSIWRELVDLFYSHHREWVSHWSGDLVAAQLLTVSPLPLRNGLIAPIDLCLEGLCQQELVGWMVSGLMSTEIPGCVGKGCWIQSAPYLLILAPVAGLGAPRRRLKVLRPTNT